MSAAAFIMRMARIEGSAPMVVYAHDIVAGRMDALPGWRYYHYLSAGGYPMGHSSTQGALVLYDLDAAQQRCVEHDDDSDEALIAIHAERTQRLHTGPMSEHLKRARTIAVALSDGAYLAVHRLDALFHLRTGPRDGSTYDSLRRALDAAQLDYHRLREHLIEDAGVPWLAACIVAREMTYNDPASPFYIAPPRHRRWHPCPQCGR